MKKLSKYIERHADPVARDGGLVETAPAGPFDHCVVIPACNERPQMRRGLEALGPQTLCIVVVNGDHDDATVAANGRLLETLREPASGPGPVFWPVDRVKGHRHGVGGARRVGTDLAAALVLRGIVRTRFVHWLDADCSVGADYFDCERAATPEDAAIVHPFRHVDRETDPAVVEAHQRYELSLRHYVLGLESAGSPYAHHSIGSTIAVEVGAYAAVRGVPLRDAGEDFHLLDKLRQVGPILRARAGPVEISMRRSSRVPFGTGPAVERILGGGEAAFYDPRCFACLREIRQMLLAQARGERLGVSEPGRGAMQALGLDGLIARLQSGADAVRARAVDVHLSGLKSLRIIHALRDAGWPSRGFAQAFEGEAGGVGQCLTRLREQESRLPLRARRLGEARSGVSD